MAEFCEKCLEDEMGITRANTDAKTYAAWWNGCKLGGFCEGRWCNAPKTKI